MMADAADAEILRRLLLDLRADEATLQAMLARGASRIQEMLEIVPNPPKAKPGRKKKGRE